MADITLIVRPVINKAVDIGANIVLGESSNLYWLQEDISWLERQMKYMLGYLENVEAKKLTNTNVDNLKKDIRDLVHDVEDILDIYGPQIESHRSEGLLKRMSTCLLPYGWTSSKFSREIEKIRRRVKDIDEDRKRYNIDDTSGKDDASHVDPRTTKLHVDDPIIVGFEEHIEELNRKLGEGHTFVSIVGMPGLGKTTLAKKVFKGIKNGFDCCASVSVSQEPDITCLMQDIANQVGLSHTNGDLEGNLCSYLQGKRYVVFLDDIWDTRAWNSFKACFPINPESASRIIITSRNSGVGRYVGGENSLHQLHPFDDLTSWELFSKLIMPTNEKFDSDLEMIGRQIVKKCGGVPLAIVVIAGMLREKEMNDISWNGVLHSIGENASDECSQILGLSYRDLSTSLKPCFLYFGNFPEDYEYHGPQVIKLWMAEKFIPFAGGERRPEDVGNDYLMTLAARNLIQVFQRGYDGSVKRFRIHDLLHTLCVNLGSEIGLFHAIADLKYSSVKRVRRLAGRYNTVARDENLIYQMTKLRALFDFRLDETTQIKSLNDMLGRFKLLQVLTLETSLAYLYIPPRIGSLSRLNYLQVQSSYGGVEIARSIRKLKNLQTLDLRQCRSVKLPIEVWKMEELRHIRLCYYCQFYSFPMWLLCQYQPMQIFLPKLQTLVGLKCYDFKPSWLRKFTNLRKLVLLKVTPEIMDELCGPEPVSKNLEFLHCLSHGCTMTKRVSLEKYGRLMKLRIQCMELQMQPPLELPPSLTKLTLMDTRLTDDPMKILKSLPKLKFLHLNNDSYLGSEMDCSGADGFAQLETLMLSGLKNLKELVEGEEMGMPKLKDVSIQNCSRLVKIPNRLQQLQ